jgi:hypothetical protein
LSGGTEIIEFGGEDDGALISGGVQDVFGFAKPFRPAARTTAR